MATGTRGRRRRHAEAYVRPPLLAVEPVSRVRHRRRVRTALVILTVALLALIAYVVDVTAGTTQDDPGVNGASVSLLVSTSRPLL